MKEICRPVPVKPKTQSSKVSYINNYVRGWVKKGTVYLILSFFTSKTTVIITDGCDTHLLHYTILRSYTTRGEQKKFSWAVKLPFKHTKKLECPTTELDNSKTHL